MRERVFRFGGEQRLVGVLTEPSPQRQRPETPAVLFLTAGLVHRVGPFRMYVDLARGLGELGFTSLRFDLSGRGDSDRRHGVPNDLDYAVDDTRQAIDFITAKTGHCHSLLVGLCSGAVDAHQSAVADSRVVGAVMIDGYAYRTLGYYLWRIGRPLVDFRMQRSLLVRSWQTMTSQRVGVQSDLAPLAKVYDTDFPPKQQIRSELVALLKRETNLLFVFTGGVPSSFNHRSQFREMFGDLASHPRLDLQVYPRADHTFSWLQDRQEFYDRLTEWIVTRFS